MRRLLLKAIILSIFLAPVAFSIEEVIEKNAYYIPLKKDLFLVWEDFSLRRSFWRRYFDEQAQFQQKRSMEISMLLHGENDPEEKGGSDSEDEENSPKTVIDEQTRVKLEKERLFLKDAFDPILRSRNILYSQFDEMDQVAIVYAVNVNPLGDIITKGRYAGRYGFKNFKPSEIEMSVMVLSKAGVPFQLHMGIVRGLEHYRSYLAGDNPSYHTGIASRLHAFAAKVMLDHIDDSKVYLITTPMAVMADILKKDLRQNSFWVGQGADSPVSESGTIEPGSTVRLPTFSRDFRFELKEGGKTIFQTDAKDAKAHQMWFFGNVQPWSVPYFIVKLSELAKL